MFQSRPHATRYKTHLQEWDLSVCLFHRIFGGECLSSDFEDMRPNRPAKTATAPYEDSDTITDPYDMPVYEEALRIFKQNHPRTSKPFCVPSVFFFLFCGLPRPSRATPCGLVGNPVSFAGKPPCPWLLLGNTLHVCISYGLVVEIQPLNNLIFVHIFAYCGF